MLQCVMEYFKYSPPETLLYDVRNLKLECVPGVERYILVSGGTNGNWQWHNNGCGEPHTRISPHLLGIIGMNHHMVKLAYQVSEAIWI